MDLPVTVCGSDTSRPLLVIPRDPTVLLPTPPPACNDHDLLFYSFSLRIIKTKKYASSGLIMYHVATALCSNITLYGFYPYDKSPSGKQLSHHYYEPNLTTFKTKVHDFEAEFKHFTALHEKKEFGWLNIHVHSIIGAVLYS